MSGIRHKYRIAREVVDDAIATLNAQPRTYGGHRIGVEDAAGIVRPYFKRGDRVKLRDQRGEFRGLMGHGGALVHFGARGKRVVPVRLLERV